MLVKAVTPIIMTLELRTGKRKSNHTCTCIGHAFLVLSYLSGEDVNIIKPKVPFIVWIAIVAIVNQRHGSHHMTGRGRRLVPL